MSKYNDVLLKEIKDGVLTVTLNRPNAMNALNEELKQELFKLPAEINTDDEIRAVVITGSGRGFCSGADVHWFTERDKGPRFRYEYRRIHDFFDELERVEKPVIAAINGVCAGGGLELALSCDIRIGIESARFLYPEHRIGLIPGSGGCSRMINIIGASWTKYMVLTGAQLEASEAKNIGLIHESVSDEELVQRVREYTDRLCNMAPLSVGMAKHIININTGIDQHTARFVERLGQSVLTETDDHGEGVAAFLEKRKPSFTGK